MAEESNSQLTAVPKVRFIRDVPADDDFFTTHSRVAEAIVHAIRENPEIKVIGLLGRWGSGKSTVANKVVELLEEPKNSEFKVFPYDAWLHQSDPLRRSFLESLILALVRADAIAPRKWTRKLRKLNRPVEDARTIETPVLSPDARWLALSLLAVPIALGFLGFDTLTAAFGEEPTSLARWTVGLSIFMLLLPVITWGWLYLVRRPWSQILDPEHGFRDASFWEPLDAEGERVSAFRIFVDGPSRQTDTRTFRANEPTSLEFGRMFQKIMREVDERKHRLVILIDNLDRVDEDEALGMWATIRSFFLASDETEDTRSEPFHPTVILPIDRHAVEDLFAGGDGTDPRAGRDRARSFMDKTFDVTFEVTEPVSSDWREFLSKQMQGMFGEAFQPHWAFWTRRLFESELARSQAKSPGGAGRPSAIVTPREINKLLNRVGALYLQWFASGIPVEVMALYVIRRDDIDGGILRFLQSHEAEIAEVAPDWKRQLAALHYGVKLDKAAQVLLAEPIRDAITTRDEAALRELSAIPGFGEIFEYATVNLPAPAVPATPFDMLTNAIFLLHAVDADEAEWAANAWRNLVSVYSATAGLVTPAPTSVDIIKLLFDHVATDGRGAFVNTSASLISGVMVRQRRRVDGTAQAAEALIQYASVNGLQAPLLELEADAPVFLSLLSEFSGSPRIWPQLRTTHDSSVLNEALSEMLVTESVQRKVPNAVLRLAGRGGADLYGGDTEIDFEALAEQANQVVRDPENHGGDAIAGIRVLARLAYGRQEGRKLLIALVDDGIVATRLDDVAEKRDWEAVADVIAILLWRGDKFSPPTAFHWSDYPQKDRDHLRRIIASVKRYFPGSIVPILWGARKANILQSSFFETIISYAVEFDALEKFDTKPVFKDLIGYKFAVPSRYREQFLEQVNRQGNFLETLEEGPLGPEIAEAADYLRRKGGEDADRANLLIRNRVEQAATAAWSEAIDSGQEPFGMALSFIKTGGLKLGRKSGLYEALNDAIPSLVRDAGREMRGRWFKLIPLLTPRCRKTLLQTLGEELGSAAAAQALHVLKAGGVQFLKTGGFTSRIDQSVRTIIIPQLARKDGRAWLKDNREELTSWVQKSDPKTRDELLKVINGMLHSRHEDRQYAADILASKWGLRTEKQ